ncbi:hypothetical protein [Bremerella cremea]|uniref:hypothetical protein n=1 Tax=Bremerella cremea TaxID=1031537 RepID=UPI0031EA1672
MPRTDPNLPPRCMADDCQRPAHARGLCSSHYQAALRVIQQTELTWEVIAQSGMCRQQAKAGRGRCRFARRLVGLAQRLTGGAATTEANASNDSAAGTSSSCEAS